MQVFDWRREEGGRRWRGRVVKGILILCTQGKFAWLPRKDFGKMASFYLQRYRTGYSHSSQRGRGQIPISSGCTAGALRQCHTLWADSSSVVTAGYEV